MDFIELTTVCILDTNSSFLPICRFKNFTDFDDCFLIKIFCPQICQRSLFFFTYKLIHFSCLKILKTKYYACIRLKI